MQMVLAASSSSSSSSSSSDAGDDTPEVVTSAPTVSTDMPPASTPQQPVPAATAADSDSLANLIGGTPPPMSARVQPKREAEVPATQSIWKKSRSSVWTLQDPSVGSSGDKRTAEVPETELRAEIKRTRLVEDPSTNVVSAQSETMQISALTISSAELQLAELEGI
jgi:hypothetical protein